MVIRKIFIAPIRFYRYFISPLFPPSCRFTPTCSQYAIESIEEFGIFKGSYLALVSLKLLIGRNALRRQEERRYNEEEQSHSSATKDSFFASYL